MKLRPMAMQIWVAMSVVWLAASGLLTGSAYLEVQFRDAVRLEQHAKDLRAAGIDPASVDWTLPMVVNGYAVPPVRQDAPLFWKAEGSHYALLAASLPVTLLFVIQTLFAALPRRRRRARALVFSVPADSPVPCNLVPVRVASRSSR
jgi:hypothetical protein